MAFRTSRKFAASDLILPFMGAHKREIFGTQLHLDTKKTGYKKPWAVESARELPVFFSNSQQQQLYYVMNYISDHIVLMIHEHEMLL